MHCSKFDSALRLPGGTQPSCECSQYLNRKANDGKDLDRFDSVARFLSNPSLEGLLATCLVFGHTLHSQIPSVQHALFLKHRPIFCPEMHARMSKKQKENGGLALPLLPSANGWTHVHAEIASITHHSRPDAAEMTARD